jgi:hypothetical protein
MKNVNLTFAGLFFVALLCSCSSEDSLDISNHSTQESSATSRFSAFSPDNKLNPNDYAGESYRSLLSDYQSGNYSPESLAEVGAVVDALRGTPTLTVMSLDATTDAFLSNIIQSPEATFVTILQQSGLSQDAKNILSDFVEGFDALEAKPFDEIYSDIVSLESTISGLNSLTANDRTVLLTVTSITRHSFSNKCCEDTDWKTSVGNIVAATAGALVNSDLAVRYALITRIAEFELVTL